MSARLREDYQKSIRKRLFEKMKYSSVMQVPRLEKIVLNVGMGDAHSNATALTAIIDELSTITGQKAVKTVAKKSIANFKIRDGQAQDLKQAASILVGKAVERIRADAYWAGRFN